MTRTKNQARAGRVESARRSTAVNERERSRVGTTTAREANGDEASSASDSERARRAANRSKMNAQMTSATSNQDARVRTSAIATDGGRDRQTTEDGAHVDHEGAASGSGSAMVAEGGESENYFTALVGDETGEVNGEVAAAETEESAEGQSEAPSIKSPHKARAGGTSNI